MVGLRRKTEEFSGLDSGNWFVTAEERGKDKLGSFFEKYKMGFGGR